jgi:opacity protein-like surface antigen
MAFAQQPCRFCDTTPPYKHSIDIQVNRAFTRASIWVDYLLEKSKGTYDKEKYAYAFFSNIRYGYRVLPFLSIGPELIYENERCPLSYQETDENQNLINEKIDDEITRVKAGTYARLHGNWLKVFKPYADLGLGYFYLRNTWTPKNQERTDLFSDKKVHKFDFYVGAGMSFMIWKNHFNIDLGAKYSPVLWSNIFSKKVVFTWKIGYNFNAKK